MGRTQRTYRMRMLAIRDEMMKSVRSKSLREKYRNLWVGAHRFSAEGSMFPWPNTHGVATFCMVLEAWYKASNLDKKMIEFKSNIN